jgi:hypothetical protein
LISPDFRPPLAWEQDAMDGAAYWRDKEVKIFAVDVVAGPARRLTYGKTFYCRAQSAPRAIAAVKTQAIAIPSQARFSTRLAGPRELGCVPTSASGTP